MKAGIYKTPNGNLIYVSKDRTIKATTLSPSSWPGMKVSHRAKDDTVSFLDYRCTRFADVPNGCTDHQAYLAELHRKAAAERVEGEILLDFEDNGQDFLHWRLRDDAEGFTRVVACEPFQGRMWLGRVVHNADDLVRGLTDVVHVSAQPGMRGFDLAHRVVRAARAMHSLGEAVQRATQATRTFSVEYAPGFRVCHKASARKHRRRGDQVIALGDGRFAWAPKGTGQEAG